jgi:hypothetical protein
MENWKIDADRRTKASLKRSLAERGRWCGKTGLFILALAPGCFMPAHAVAEVELESRAAPKQHAVRYGVATSLEDRVKLLAKELELDASQQSELKKLLESQREQVRRVWDESSLAAPYRVSATQAISERTADQIRLLLNDKQKQKYNAPRKPRDILAGSAQPDVEAWMNATK